MLSLELINRKEKWTLDLIGYRTGSMNEVIDK